MSKKTATTRYEPSLIEPKWQSKWIKEGVYQPDLENAKRPFYNLMMFPYPSAEGLHIGSIFTFGGVDVYGRFKRMQGNDVFQPIGLDGFGIHSENHALKTGSHPMDHALRTEENFYRQLRSTGISYAWDNKVETYDPDYYRWTQWLFIALFKAGLAYKKKSPVNFCPSCKTVLADEQVIDGKCERCGSIVEKKDLEQWFFKITDYAERLLTNIEGLDWSERVKIAQRNWIGKSQGVYLDFRIKNQESKIKVFTTAIDTVYGVTFIVLSPEHPLVGEILKQVQDDSIKQEVEAYREEASNKSEIERTSEGKDKTGVFSGAYVIHPFTNEEVPIWIADYVVSGYGTGAVMGVPGHDARDHAFAQKYGLEIRPVVRPTQGVKDAKVAEDGFWDYKDIKGGYKDKSELFNSGDLDGLTSREAKVKLEQQIEDKKIGKKTATYHLRDWLISRQRYWGPPIPMIYCEACAGRGDSWFTSEEAKNSKHKEKGKEMAGWYPAEDLPVELPHVENYKPMGTGKAPLANYPEFYETTCPHCGGKAIRETDVSDTFLDSSWYFLRYLATDSKEVPFPMTEEKVKEFKGAEAIEKRSRFLPVTMYIGGAEHSVLHLLYARFVTMVLSDLGYLNFEEPFAIFYAHGLIIKDGAKMSKSKGNVINPDEYIKKFGADSVRCYLLFLGPFNQGGDFQDTAMEGMSRFIKRVWTLFTTRTIINTEGDMSAKSLRNTIIKEVTEELEHLRFNTSLARLMTYYNHLVNLSELPRADVEAYLKLLAPFAPHMTEELWHNLLNSSNSIHLASWPAYDEQAIIKEVVTIPVQVNGKLRATLEISSSEVDDKEKIEEEAKNTEKVKPFLEGRTIKKFIYIPGKVVNFVVS